MDYLIEYIVKKMKIAMLASDVKVNYATITRHNNIHTKSRRVSP